MPIRRIRIPLVTVALLLLLGSTGSVAQRVAEPATAAPEKPAFTPHSGQAGKDVIWVPTPQALVDRMLDMAGLTPDDQVIDLGSGDGRTVITAARRGARAHGIEYNPDMVELSRRNAEAEGVAGRATFEQADIFASDFSRASVITLFLLPHLNLKLRPDLLEMKPGTRVVSNSFDMEDWQPDETIDAGPGCSSWCRAFLWIVPAKVDGQWRLGADTLKLEQTFQMLAGALSGGSTPAAVSDGRLRGDAIAFTVAGRRYEGRVDGGRMSGRVAGGGEWSAVRIEN